MFKIVAVGPEKTAMRGRVTSTPLPSFDATSEAPKGEYGALGVAADRFRVTI